MRTGRWVDILDHDNFIRLSKQVVYTYWSFHAEPTVALLVMCPRVHGQGTTSFVTANTRDSLLGDCWRSPFLILAWKSEGLFGLKKKPSTQHSSPSKAHPISAELACWSHSLPVAGVVLSTMNLDLPEVLLASSL